MKKINKFNPLIRKLLSTDNDLLLNFNSGKDNFAFDNFLKKEAKRDMGTGDGITYLIIDEKKVGSKKCAECLVAYFTISTGAINIIDRYDFEDDEIPEDKKREHFSPISAFYINMFAVDINYQNTMFEGDLISGLILKYIIHELREMSISIIGAKVIILCSVLNAVEFYKRNGEFEEFSSKYTLLDKVDLYDTIPMKLVLHKI